MSIWIAILSSTVGYLLPNPNFWTNLFSQMTEFSWTQLVLVALAKLSLFFRCCWVKHFIQILNPKLILSVSYFYREYQPIISIIERLINIQYIKLCSFDIVKYFNNGLLVFDESCEEIYNDKVLIKTTTSGRHRSVHVIHINTTGFNIVDGLAELI